MLNFFLKDVKFYFIIKVFLSLSWLLSVYLYTNFLNAAEYGYYSILQFLINLFSLFSVSWLGGAAIRLFSISNTIDLYASLFRLVYWVLALMFPLFIILEKLLLEYNILPELNYFTILISSFFFVTQALINFLFAKLSSERNLNDLMVFSICQTILPLLISYYFLKMTSFKIDGIISSWLITNIVIIFFIYKKYDLHKIILHKNPNLSGIMVYGLPIILINILSLLLVSGDKLILKYYGFNHILGIYSANYDISDKSIMAFSSILKSTYVPIFFSIDANEDRSSAYYFHKKVVRLFFLLVIPVLISLILIYPYFSFYYFPEEYNAPDLSKIIMISSFFWAITALFSDLLTLQNKTLVLAICYVIPVMYNFIANYIFIPQYAAIAAAYNTLISYFILFISVLIANFIYNRRYFYIT